MSGPRPIAEVCADIAWERYEEASAAAAKFCAGSQRDLWCNSLETALEWHGIAIACDREAARG